MAGIYCNNLLNLDIKEIEVSMFSLIFSIVFFAVFSPLLPMLYLLYRYFSGTANKITISLIMIAVCSLNMFLCNLYADHSHGFDGLRALGAILGGFFGTLISLVFLMVSIARHFRH